MYPVPQFPMGEQAVMSINIRFWSKYLRASGWVRYWVALCGIHITSATYENRSIDLGLVKLMLTKT